MYERIYKVLQKAVDDKVVAGVNVLAFKNGQELAYCEYGFRDIENHKPMSRDTIFRMYSMTKPITSAAVMILVSRGLVDIGENVAAYLPEFSKPYVNCDGVRRPAVRPITVKNLLNMTSGLLYPDDNTECGRQIGRVFSELDSRLYGDNPMTTAEFSEAIAANELCFDPGEHFMYGVSADILGALIERVSGERLSEFLKKEIFEPLGMHDTGFFVPEEKSDRLAKVYNLIGDELAEVKTNHLGIRYYMDKPPAFESGGAGLCSTLDDYAKFAHMLLNSGTYRGKQIIPKKAVEYMTRGRLTANQQADLQRDWGDLAGYSYGNLMRVCEDEAGALLLTSKGEYGWDGWLGTYFANEPACGTTLLMGVQRIDGDKGAIVRRLRNILSCAAD